MFTPSHHPYVGTRRVYIPQGYSPYAPADDLKPGVIILRNGDAVTVESAWTRDYLPADAPMLLYVRSESTGEVTHVTAADLPLALDSESHRLEYEEE